MTYTETSSPDSGDVMVSASGAGSTSGQLAAGVYPSPVHQRRLRRPRIVVLTLTVTAVPIDETTRTSAWVTTTDSAGFTDQLATSGGSGSVTNGATSPDTGDVIVSSTGGVKTSGALVAGSCTVSGGTSHAR